MLKATGVVRKVDRLGRIVLPKEIRDVKGIEESTPLEIFVEEDSIVLKKYVPGCSLCGSVEKVVDFKGKHICSSCISELRRR